jgi:hypothetical protein
MPVVPPSFILSFRALSPLARLRAKQRIEARGREREASAPRHIDFVSLRSDKLLAAEA